MIELKSNKTTYLGKAKKGRNRFALQGFMGAVQMRKPGGDWLDIKPRLIRDTDGWHVEGAPYDTSINDEGQRLIYPNKTDKISYLRLPPLPFLRTLSKEIISEPTKLDSQVLPNRLRIPSSFGYVDYLFTNTGVKFEVLFSKAPPASVFGKDSLKIAFDIDTNLDVKQLLENGKRLKGDLAIPLPRLLPANLDDLSPELKDPSKWLEWQYKNGQLVLEFDLSGLKFPILLRNGTIEQDVSASAHDAYEDGAGGFSYTDSYCHAWANGNTSSSSYKCAGMLFSLTIPQGATIGTAYTKQYIKSYDDPLLDIYCEDVDDADDFNETQDVISRARTGDSAAWVEDNLGNGYIDSPSIVDPVQEVINRESWSSGNNLVILYIANTDDTKFCRWYSYDKGSNEPGIYIEYEAGAGTQTITPSAIATAEAFGSHKANLWAVPSAIASLEGFGTLKANLKTEPSGIASAEAVGSQQLNLKMEPSGIASAEALGTPQLNFKIETSGIESVEEFGTLKLLLKVIASAISSAEAFGATTITQPGGAQTIEPSGIESAEEFGTLKLLLKVIAAAISSAEAFGATTVIQPGGGQTIEPSGIESLEAFGATVVIFAPYKVVKVYWQDRTITVYWSDREMKAYWADRNIKVVFDNG